jgi:hypothetical protein
MFPAADTVESVSDRGEFTTSHSPRLPLFPDENG